MITVLNISFTTYSYSNPLQPCIAHQIPFNRPVLHGNPGHPSSQVRPFAAKQTKLTFGAQGARDPGDWRSRRNVCLSNGSTSSSFFGGFMKVLCAMFIYFLVFPGNRNHRFMGFRGLCSIFYSSISWDWKPLR